MKKTYYIVNVIQKSKMDRYYRDNRHDAEGLEKMNKGMFPKADVFITVEDLDLEKVKAKK